MSRPDEFREAIARAEGIDPADIPQSVPLVNDPPAGNTGVNMYNPRGDAEYFNNNQYQVNNFMYPSDLHANQGVYGGNYVIFYINIVNDSSLNGGRGNLDVNGNPVETLSVADEALLNRDRGQLVALGLDATELTGAIAAQSAVGAIAAGGLSLTSAAGAATAAGTNTIGAGVTAAMAPSASRQTKRLKTAIAMHVPNQLQVRYSSQWSEEDTAAFAMTQGIGAGLINAIQNFGEQGNLENTADTLGAAGANIYLSKGVGAGAVSAATGLAANPKKEQVFKGVDFRTFTFEYQFFPRSAEESRNVQNIIKQFKYHMHPEMKDDRNFLYLYPSEFDISYYQNGRENLNLHRHTSCVLTEMSVNYTPNGVFTTFNDGTPTQINVAMTFKELALLTKEKIRDGL
jgi:hypothetical protein